MTTFSDFNFLEPLAKAITEASFSTPTPIQEKAIPLILEGKDIFGIAQTGTGKTASFILPLIQTLQTTKARARMPRALVLSPTRELAEQTAAAFATFSKHTKLKAATLIGGTGLVAQERTLQKGVDVLIATPGRLIDLQERGKILLHSTSYLVIDEADRMLDMGFVPEVEAIVKLLPKNRQTLLFSATSTPEIKKLSTRFLNQPEHISVSAPMKTADSIKQYIVRTNQRNRNKELRTCLEQEKVQSAIVFCNRKSEATNLHLSFKRYNIESGLLHGDLTQSKRSETLDQFRSGQLKILVASDVAARGIDIDTISHVFNYSVPINNEDYVHRIGRTGRAGREGVAITFITPEDEKNLDKLSKSLKNTFEEYITKTSSSEKQPQTPTQKPHQMPTKRQDTHKDGHKRPQDANRSQKYPDRRPQFTLLPPMSSKPMPGFGEHTPAFFHQEGCKRKKKTFLKRLLNFLKGQS